VLSLIASIDMESALHGTASLYSELARVQRRRWKSIAIIAAGCGGCGAEPAAGDVRFLVQQWLDTPEYRAMLLAPRFSHLGFAERVAAKLLSPRSASPDSVTSPGRRVYALARFVGCSTAFWPNPICSANSDRRAA
jgi:hypothetical protein